MVKGAWVTLATNDSYSLGALVLAHSLKQVGTQQELAILITPGVTNSMRERLSEVFSLVKEVNVLDSRDKENLKLLQRPELGITFTKLHCWQLTEYEKCVFLDADTLVLQNCDELFQREELSAAPDVGWPDCFNSGVFVYRPSMETYNNLIQFALDKGSFDGGDQGLLNLYFSDWAHKDITKHLPFIYNVCSTAFYSYLPAFKQYGKDMKIIHFIGNAKPWLQYFDTESRKVRPSRDVGHLEAILQMWWNIFCSMIHPNLSSDMSGLAGAFARLTLGQQRSPEQEALENCLRRQNWEQGNIDYLGRDSFDNIWSKICETLSKTPQEDEDNSTQIRTEDSTLVSPQPESDPVLKEVISQQVLSSDDSTSCEIVQEKASTISTPSAKPEDACSDSTKTVPTQETTTDPQLPTQSPEDNLSVEKVSSQSLETAKEVTTVVQETIPSSELAPGQQTQMESKAEDMPDSVQVSVEEKSRPVLPETKQSECLTQDVPLEEKSSTAPTQQVVPQPESDPKLTEADQSKSSISTEKSLKETLPKTTAPIQTADRSIDDEASQCKLPQKPLEKENSQAERSQIESHKPQSHPETSPDNILPKPAEQICSLGKSPSKVSSETEPKQSPISTEGQICSLEETAKTSVPKEPSKQQSPSTVSEPKDNLEKASTIAKTSAVTEPTELKQGSPTSAVQTCSLDKSGSISQTPAVTESPNQKQSTSENIQIQSVEKTSIQTQATPDIKTSQPSDSHKKSTQSASVVPQTPPAPTPMVSSVESPPPITPPPRKNGGKKNQTKSKK